MPSGVNLPDNRVYNRRRFTYGVGGQAGESRASSIRFVGCTAVADLADPGEFGIVLSRFPIICFACSSQIQI